MDRTILTLVALLLSSGGIFATLLEYSAPELGRAFWGDNAFIQKAEIIRRTASRFFMVIAVGAVLLQGFVEALGDMIPTRVHGTGVYLAILAAGVPAVALLLWLLRVVSRAAAKRKWLPIVASSQAEVFAMAKRIFADENATDLERCEALEALSRVERLLEVDGMARNPDERIACLEPYFARAE